MAKYSCRICGRNFQFQQDLDKHKQYEHAGFSANPQSKSADRPSRYESNKRQMSQPPRMFANDSTDGRMSERIELDEIRTVDEHVDDAYNRRPQYSQQDSRFSYREVDEDSSSDSSDNEEEESVESQLEALREKCIPLKEKLRGPIFKDLMKDLDNENATDKIKASTKGVIFKTIK